MLTPVKAQKVASPASLPADYEVRQHAVGNQTRLATNNNKFYSLELHELGDGTWRVYTQYGRVGEEGTHEIRGPMGRAAAEKEYLGIFKKKMKRKKDPYTEIDVASLEVGSVKARGASAGHIDAATKARIEDQDKPKKKAKKAAKAAPKMDPALAALVKDLFGQATKALTTQVDCQITANGIKTPMGVLTLGQVEKGAAVLDDIHTVVKEDKAPMSTMQHLTGQFFTHVPTKMGRSKRRLQDATIDTLAKVADKYELLQLMRDMLQVNGESGDVLVSDDTHAKYKSMGATIVPLSGSQFQEIARAVEASTRKRTLKVKRAYAVKRPAEWKAFAATGAPIGNLKLLYHGSRFSNWTGILTRGILMPKLVVAMGGSRTDGGWLGNGMYFGSEACTSWGYASAGGRRTCILALCRVALGKQKKYTRITYGLTRPPQGFDSNWGVQGTGFYDNELVVYNVDAKGAAVQSQRIEYLVEI